MDSMFTLQHFIDEFKQNFLSFIEFLYDHFPDETISKWKDTAYCTTDFVVGWYNDHIIMELFPLVDAKDEQYFKRLWLLLSLDMKSKWSVMDDDTRKNFWSKIQTVNTCAKLVGKYPHKLNNVVQEMKLTLSTFSEDEKEDKMFEYIDARFGLEIGAILREVYEFYPHVQTMIPNIIIQRLLAVNRTPTT